MILTDSRHNLGKDVLGDNAYSSMYESETGITNKLVRLVIAKKNIFE